MATFTPEQLQTWRTEGGDRLMQLLTSWGDRPLETADYKADEVVRKLNGKPARPADKAPYASLYPDIAIAEARKKAARLIQQKITALPMGTLSPEDGWLDEVLRIALGKSDRATDAPPYADLFTTPQPEAKPEAKPGSKPTIDTSAVKLSLDQLLEIAPSADLDQVTRLYPHIVATLAEFDLTTPLRQAHFLAQLCHESGSFNYLEELASGEDYEWRDDLGNVEAGDGVRFKGRGLIQITGRTNYGDCGEALGVDLLANPTRLADDDLACRSAGWFWGTRDLSSFADRDDVDSITYRINGGYNGYDDRLYYLGSAKEVLGV
jgi:putative chitinase